METKSKSSDNRFWLIGAGIIAAILLLPKILEILIQIMIIVLISIAVAFITLGVLRIIGIKIYLSSISDKLNSLLGLKKTSENKKNSIGK